MEMVDQIGPIKPIRGVCAAPPLKHFRGMCRSDDDKKMTYTGVNHFMGGSSQDRNSFNGVISPIKQNRVVWGICHKTIMGCVDGLNDLIEKITAPHTGIVYGVMSHTPN